MDRRSVLAARLVVVLFRTLEQAAKTTPLTIPQYRFMLQLKRGPRRASDLAALAGIGRPTASALVADMERKGLIYRSRDGADGRAASLRLTDEGLRCYSELDTLLAEAFDAQMPDDQRDLILSGFSAMAETVDARARQRED